MSRTDDPVPKFFPRNNQYMLTPHLGKETSISGQEWVPGTRFTFLLSTTESWTKHIKQNVYKMVFKHRSIGSARLCCWREGKQNTSLWIAPWLARGRSQAAAQGEEPCLVRRGYQRSELQLRMQRWLDLSRSIQERREEQRERWGVCSRVSLSLWQSAIRSAWEETTWG